MCEEPTDDIDDERDRFVFFFIEGVCENPAEVVGPVLGFDVQREVAVVFLYEFNELFHSVLFLVSFRLFGVLRNARAGECELAENCVFAYQMSDSAEIFDSRGISTGPFLAS